MINVKESIFCIEALDDGMIGVIDQASAFRKIDPKSLKIVDGYKSKLYHPQKITNLVAVSSSGNYSIHAIPKREQAALYNNHDRKLVAKIGIHQGEIEAVAFSRNEQYAATGGTDGKSYVYYASNGTMLFTLPPHRDYVSSIAFSPNSHYVATGSFDQTILIKNIVTMDDHFRLIGHSSVIKKLLFVSNDELISADKEGNVIIWGVKSKRLKKRLPKISDEITDLTLSRDKEFLFVSSIKGYIALYHLGEQILLMEKYIQSHSPIYAIAIQDMLLCYGNDEGDIETFSLLQDEELLQEYIQVSQYAQAYGLVKHNQLLKYSSQYIALEAEWKRIFEEAREALIAGKKDEATWLLTPFEKVSSKQADIKHLLEDFVDFGKFQHYIKEKKYSLAYGLASKYKSYQETKEFAILEQIWDASFNKAKALLLEEEGEEKARKYLVQFRSIPSKSQEINELFDQRKVYMLFKKKLEKRDFETIFKLVKTYPFLAQYKEFKDMLRWSDQIFIKIGQLLELQEYIEAIKLARKIQDFPDFKNDIHFLIEQPQVFIKFGQAMQTDKKELIYAFIAKYPFLAELPVSITFEQAWEGVEQEALKMVALGDVLAVLSKLNDYAHIPYKRIQIATILKSSLFHEIQSLIDQEGEPQKIVKLIELFINFFGSDDLLRSLVNDYSFQKGVVIDCDSFTKGDMEKIDFETFKEAYVRWNI